MYILGQLDSNINSAYMYNTISLESNLEHIMKLSLDQVYEYRLHSHIRIQTIFFHTPDVLSANLIRIHFSLHTRYIYPSYILFKKNVHEHVD